MSTTTTSTQTFELSEDDLKIAVAEFIESRFGKGGPLAVSVESRTVTTGYGRSECDTQVVKASATRRLSAPAPRAERLPDISGYGDR